MQKFFSATGFWESEGVSILRILTGLFMIYHGQEVFSKDQMDGYSQWLTDLKFPSPVFAAYLGKGTELAGGILLTLGLFTRLIIIPLILAMCGVTFGMGHGKIFTDDQHPFLFVVLFLLFFFTGPGKWSIDYLVFKRKNIH